MANAPSTRMGRPRDPDLEAKVYRAARSIYNDLGWPQFTFRRVSEVSGVGKNALYRRWQSPKDLLFAALRINPVRTVGPEVSAREALVSLTGDLVSAFSGPNRLVSLRIYLEAQIYPDIFRSFNEDVIAPVLVYAHGLVRRGVASGEIAPGTDPVMLLNVLHGAVISHSLIRERARDFDSEHMPEDDAFARSLVAFAFAGCAP